MGERYRRWSMWPYAGETKPPRNPDEPLAGSWPLFYLKRRKDGGFSDLFNKRVVLRVKHPNTIDWRQQLSIVQKELKMLTPKKVQIAKYWGTGVATKQWTPIIDRLIDTYKVSPPQAARILAVVQAGMNDTFVLTWYLKFLWNVARPNQYDSNLATVICTPRHPTYTSGHAGIAGCAQIILSYFFPGEANRLKILAEECAVSRLYAGVHFPVDNEQGLRLGRQIGHIVVNTIARQRNSSHKPVDKAYRKNLNAKLPPPPYKQVIPFVFPKDCTSKVRLSR